MERNSWRRTAERVQQDIIRLGHAGLDTTALRAALLKRLRKVIPIDLAAFETVDPATLLFTSTLVDEPLAPAVPRLMKNEILSDDVNKFWELARGKRPVGQLHVATQGRLERSSRYRDVFEPMHLGDELRAALRLGDLSWGCLCLHRERSAPRFTAEEASFLERVAPHMALGLRTPLLLSQAIGSEAPEGPGVLMLSDDLTLVGMTPPAERWLAEIAAHDWPRTSGLPISVYAIATSLQEIERGEMPLRVTAPRMRLRTAAGHWLVLQASRLAGQIGRGLIAVVIEAARPLEIAPFIAQAYDLSPRERAVTQLVLQGRSTNEIAAAIQVSVHTVQDHLKAIFDKAGVRSRRELVARMSAQYHQPQIEIAAASI